LLLSLLLLSLDVVVPAQLAHGQSTASQEPCCRPAKKQRRPAMPASGVRRRRAYLSLRAQISSSQCSLFCRSLDFVVRPTRNCSGTTTLILHPCHTVTTTT
jgi:hypothetical protein